MTEMNVVRHRFRNFVSTEAFGRLFCRGLITRKFASANSTSSPTKDVVLFKYENQRFIRILKLFSVSQFSFWGYLSYITFTTLRNIPGNQDPTLPWWRRMNLGEPKFRYGLSLTSGIIACGVLASCCGFIMRSVNRLVLHKGGKSISIVTYYPVGPQRTITVNLSEVSCEHSRHSSRVQLPLKISGHRFYYLLDMRGEFTNGRLFDQTAGMKRILRK